MSTRATIGVRLTDGTYICIYCYRDGYPEHLGKMLVRNYDTIEKIGRLMRGGHLKDIGSTPELSSYQYQGNDLLPEDCRPVTRANIDDFIQKVLEYGHDYGYVFQDGKWHVYKAREFLIPMRR